MVIRKPIELLTVADLAANPIWKFENRDELGETSVRPVKVMPVQNLDGMVIGTQVRLASGCQKWALLGNIRAEDPRLTELFLTCNIELNGEWLHLARYFDSHYPRLGPEALARSLGLQVDNVFPISFDVRRYCQGNPAALAGGILKAPRERLTRNEMIALSVRR